MDSHCLIPKGHRHRKAKRDGEQSNCLVLKVTDTERLGRVGGGDGGLVPKVTFTDRSREYVSGREDEKSSYFRFGGYRDKDKKGEDRHQTASCT